MKCLVIANILLAGSPQVWGMQEVLSKLAVTPFEPFGASVGGVDLSEEGSLSPADAEEIRGAMQQHGLLLFRGQRGLNPAQMFELASAFSNKSSLRDPSKTVYWTEAGQPDFPMVRALGNDDDTLLSRIGYEWHSDGNDLTMMGSVKALDPGGETLFVTAKSLYEALSPEQRERAEDLRVHYSNRYTAGGPAAIDAEHGLRMSANGVRRIREASGRKEGWQLAESQPVPAVYDYGMHKRLILSAKNLDRVEGLTLNDSQTLIEDLLLAGLQPSHIAKLDADLLPIERTVFSSTVMEHKWQDGDIVLWDNRAVLHCTTPVALYRGQRRVFHFPFNADLMPDSGLLRRGWKGGWGQRKWQEECADNTVCVSSAEKKDEL